MTLSKVAETAFIFSPNLFLSGLGNFIGLFSRSFVIFLLLLSISSKFLFQVLNFSVLKFPFGFWLYFLFLSADFPFFIHILSYLTEYNSCCFKVLSVSISDHIKVGVSWFLFYIWEWITSSWFLICQVILDHIPDIVNVLLWRERMCYVYSS